MAGRRTVGAGVRRKEMALAPANHTDVTRPSPPRDVETLKVSTRSNPNSVAGALAGVLRTDGSVRVQVVGAGALNQAVKAIAIARTYVADGGIDVVCVPSFAEIDIDGESRTAICLDVHDQAGTGPRRDDALDLPATVALAEEALAADLAPTGHRASPSPPT